MASWTKSPIIMHKISAHRVHLAVTDVLYSKPEAEPTEEDVAEAEPLPEDKEGAGPAALADEEKEGFVLDRNVPDAVLPDMSEDFRRIIQKV